MQHDIDARIHGHNRMMGMGLDELFALFQAWWTRAHGGHVEGYEFQMEVRDGKLGYADCDVDLAWSAFYGAVDMCRGGDAELVLAERPSVQIP